MEQSIVNYLKEKYSPVGIILYGSRASEKAGKKNDWDFAIFTADSIEGGTEMIEGQTVDLDVAKFPISQKELLEEFNGTLQIARVVFDTDNTISNLLESLKKYYAKGKNLTPKELKDRINFITRRLDKLESSIENDAIFFFHLGVFYEKAIQYWFEIKQNKWRVSPGTALRIIEDEDQNYFSMLKVLYSHLSNQEKLVAAKRIIQALHY